jgi:hypothetical protein
MKVAGSTPGAAEEELNVKPLSGAALKTFVTI